MVKVGRLIFLRAAYTAVPFTRPASKAVCYFNPGSVVSGRILKRDWVYTGMYV